MATEQLPDGQPAQLHQLAFGMYPGDETFFTIVERDDDAAGVPAGSPVEVARLRPGERFYIEPEAVPTSDFAHYRFRHGGFNFQPGTPTGWFRVRPIAWSRGIPNIPQEPLLDLDLALDDDDGTVDIVANGGRRVESIKWDFSTSGYPANPSTAVDTDAEGDVTVTDAFTLTAGQTGFVTVEFYALISGQGRLLGSLRASVTRGTASDPDTTFGTLVLNGDFEHETDGAYWGQEAGRVSIETTSPISGSKSLKITSATGDDTVSHQQVSSAGLTTSARRRIPVEPGESFEVRYGGQGYSDRPISLRAYEYDGDGVQTGLTIIGGLFGSGVFAILAYTVPAGVRYISWAPGVSVDAGGPRDFLFDNFTARRVDTTDKGIPTELSVGGIYYISDVEIVPDSSGGVEGSDPGYLYWGGADWRYIHPNGSKHFVLEDSVTLVSLDGTRANTADLMCFVGFDQSRFTGLADFHMRRIVGVRKSRSAGWQYLGDSGWLAFTPNTSDGLLAEPVLTSEVV